MEQPAENLLLKEPDVKLLFSVTLLAGEILLASGAEIYRVEDTISRLLSISGYEGTASFVTPTCILMTLRDPSAETMTTLVRISERENNLARVAQVNTVARQLCAGTVTLESAQETLQQIRKTKGYSEWLIALLLILLPVCFYLFFGGINVYAGLICLVTGGWLALARRWLLRRSAVRFFYDLISAAGVAFLASLLSHPLLIDASANLVIISSIMPLVPGVAITTAIRDILHGDYQSGTARAAEAFIIAAAVAVGVGVGLFLYRLIPWQP
jgi:uncharacterized membrane protein YjjP (DUF1212 family)